MVEMINTYIFDAIKYLLIPATLFSIYGAVLKIVTYTEFDKLFLTKEKKTSFQIADFLFVNTILFFSITVLGVLFSNFNDTLLAISLSISSFILILCLFFILPICFFYWKKHVKHLVLITYASYLILTLSLISTLIIVPSNNDSMLAIDAIIFSTTFIQSIFTLYFFHLLATFISVYFLLINYNKNKDRYTLQIFTVDKIKEKKLTVLYSLDSETLVLGDGENERKSSKLYHFNRSKDSVLEFSKVQE